MTIKATGGRTARLARMAQIPAGPTDEKAI
jgi:hypothetical protein